MGASVAPVDPAVLVPDRGELPAFGPRTARTSGTRLAEGARTAPRSGRWGRRDGLAAGFVPKHGDKFVELPAGRRGISSVHVHVPNGRWGAVLRRAH